MADDFTWMLAADALAARFGDGLKPDLRAMLIARAGGSGEGVLPLPVRQVSAGPAHQDASPARLAADGIPVLHPRKDARKRAASGKPRRGA